LRARARYVRQPRPSTSLTITRRGYVEIHSDERAATCASFLERALTFLAEHGIHAKRLTTDHAFAYVHSRAFRELLARNAIRHLTTKP